MIAHVHIFGISIQTFGVFFALNFMAWGLLAARRLDELGKPPDWAFEMVLVAVVGGLIGARAYYLIQNHGTLQGSLLHNVFSGSGLVWYGGLAGGVVTMLIWARWRGFLGWPLFDIAGPGLFDWNRISMPWSGWMWKMSWFALRCGTSGVSRKITSGAFLN